MRKNVQKKKKSLQPLCFPIEIKRNAEFFFFILQPKTKKPPLWLGLATTVQILESIPFVIDLLASSKKAVLYFCHAILQCLEPLSLFILKVRKKNVKNSVASVQTL